MIPFGESKFPEVQSGKLSEVGELLLNSVHVEAWILKLITPIIHDLSMLFGFVVIVMKRFMAVQGVRAQRGCRFESYGSHRLSVEVSTWGSASLDAGGSQPRQCQPSTLVSRGQW